MLYHALIHLKEINVGKDERVEKGNRPWDTTFLLLTNGKLLNQCTDVRETWYQLLQKGLLQKQM